MPTCFNCEEHCKEKSIIHLSMESYCLKCIKNSMTPSKNGGLPSINYHFYHYIDQWYLDDAIRWTSSRRKNKRQLKKLFSNLKLKGVK